MDDDPQQPTDAADPAAVAFEALRQDVALLRAAMAGFAAEHAQAPDYSQLLGQLSQAVQATASRVEALAKRSAMTLTPEMMVQQINAASTEIGREDRAGLWRAQAAFEHIASDFRSWIASARQARLQNWRLGQATAAAAALGVMVGLWTPGAVVRAAPARWAWPEKLAAQVMRSDLWSAGERMMAAGDPARWRAVQSTMAMIAENREALERCAQAAVKAGAEARCLITVRPQGGAS